MKIYIVVRGQLGLSVCVCVRALVTIDMGHFARG